MRKQHPDPWGKTRVIRRSALAIAQPPESLSYLEGLIYWEFDLVIMGLVVQGE
jgi:hypothetical protein